MDDEEMIRTLAGEMLHELGHEAFGYSNDESAANYREHGFRAFLNKPFLVKELRGVLNALLA